jgi:hypothetical protein
MFNNQFTKKDPLVDSVKKVMEQNQREREAAAAVNDAFGIQDRKALPHEMQVEWDSVYNEVLSEGVEALDEVSKKLAAKYIKKASASATKLASDSERHYQKTATTSGDEHNDHVEKSGKADWKVSTRLKGIRRATDRLVKEEEQLDEISSKLASSYIKKRFERDYETKDGTSFKRKKSMDFPKESDKVHKNTVRALKRIKEEDEQLDEVLDNIQKMANYIGGLNDSEKKAKETGDKNTLRKRKRGEKLVTNNRDRKIAKWKKELSEESEEVSKKKRLAKILKRRLGKGDGKESVSQSRREDK